MSTPDVQELIEQGLRAAQRGQKDTARQLLMQAIRVDPRQEEAWLWLARVTDDPARKADCLRQVVQLNSNNRWAAEQLQQLERAASAPAVPAAPASAPTPPAPAPEKEFSESDLRPVHSSAQLKDSGPQLLSCPKCGGRIELRTGGDAVTVVCSYCQSILQLDEQQAATVVGRASAMKPGLIRLGQSAAFGGARYEAIGWLRIEGWDDEDRWHWEEWLLAGDNGQYRWLSHDNEEGFVLQRKVAITQAFNPRRDSRIPTPSGFATVKERSPAKIQAVQGELTWRAKVGDQFEAIEAVQGIQKYSVEAGQDEIELFEGQELSDQEVLGAFGLLEQAAAREKDLQPRRRLYTLLALVSGIFLIMGCLATMIAMASGREIYNQSVTVTKSGAPQAVGPFPITRPGAVHRVEIEGAGRLPTNSFFDVDATLVDDEDREFYLFTSEFWDEEGSDDEGAWHESDLNMNFLFKPDTAGNYYLELEVDPKSTASQLPVRVSVTEGVWRIEYIIFFCILCGLLAVVFFIQASNQRVKVDDLLKEAK